MRKDERWGPRTLDLDILLFGDEIINTERLTVPHYDMKIVNSCYIHSLKLPPNCVFLAVKACNLSSHN